MIIYLLILILIILIGAPRVIMVQQAGKLIYSIEDVPPAKAAVVFGAGLTTSGDPTRVLKDRVETAVLLYQAGKVEKVLMSGDNRFIDYNEPGAMKAYALELGMPEEDIVLDYAGRRTYDTCYRARDIFLLDDVILVTQKFHLSRALYTCKNLDLGAVGVSADLRTYRAEGYWNIREIPACMMAFFQVHITKPEPVLGDQEPIFPLE
jgi:SanA protein